MENNKMGIIYRYCRLWYMGQKEDWALIMAREDGGHRYPNIQVSMLALFVLLNLHVRCLQMPHKQSTGYMLMPEIIRCSCDHPRHVGGMKSSGPFTQQPQQQQQQIKSREHNMQTHVKEHVPPYGKHTDQHTQTLFSNLQSQHHPGCHPDGPAARALCP